MPLRKDDDMCSLIVISILLTAQLIGLALLSTYAVRHPTWTESLDAFALLRIGAAMAEDVPLISAMQAKDVSMLDERDGWIGDEGCEGEFRTLAVGGSERVRSGDLYCQK